MADDEPYVFVTVGTTSFDKLIKTVCEKKVQQILKGLGYKKIKVQYGRGEYEPVTNEGGHPTLECYRYKESIAPDIKDSALVISHAGAGSVLETLSAGRPLVVVINEDLMDNHQTELANKLHKDGYLYYTNCRDLAHLLETMDLSKLQPYEPGKPERFVQFLDNWFGIK